MIASRRSAAKNSLPMTCTLVQSSRCPDIRKQAETNRPEEALDALNARDRRGTKRAIEADIAEGAEFLASFANFAEETR